MEIIIISAVAFLAAILTFFSGFGLGTILAPVFAIFFPIEIAIALTGVVHFVNNIFKVVLIGKAADISVLLRFGVPAFFASFLGAWLLMQLTHIPTIYTYNIGASIYEISPIKLIIAVILIVFSLFEILPSTQNIQFGKDKLIIGGVLSGFFGGLSGIQGAIRSAFLIKSGLSKEAYIATGVVIACIVDISRLSIYATNYTAANLGDNLPLLVSAILSAIIGAYIGRKLLKKITYRNIQIVVAVMLIIISILLGLGII